MSFRCNVYTHIQSTVVDYNKKNNSITEVELFQFHKINVSKKMNYVVVLLLLTFNLAFNSIQFNSIPFKLISF